MKLLVFRMLALVPVLLLPAEINAAEYKKYCSSGGTYYCYIKVDDPPTDGYCDADPFNALVPKVEVTTDIWKKQSCQAPDGTKLGPTEQCTYHEVDHDGTYLQSAQVFTYQCNPCKEDEVFNIKQAGGSCIKKVVPKSCDNPTTDHPIDPVTGAKEYTHTDYRGHQAYPLSFTRYYSSFGRGWLYSYSQSLNFIDDSTVIAKRPNSNSVHFSQQDGQWQANRQPAWQLRFDDVATPARYYLTRNNITETYNADGWLTAIRNSAGQGVDLTYGVNTLTVSLADSAVVAGQEAGQSLILTLDFKDKPLGQGRADTPQLVSLLAPNGAEFKYAYDGVKLTHVLYPDDTPDTAGDNVFGEDNPVRTYLYDYFTVPQFVSGIIDENGVRISSVEYDGSGRATSSGLTDGTDTFSVDYKYQNYGDDQRVTVTNPLGKQQVIHFAEHNGSRVISRIEGKASANCLGANKNFSYDERGLLQSKTDWAGNRTHYERDERGRVVVRTEAAGTPEERITSTEWHPSLSLPITKTEPERVTRFSYDSEGRLLNKTVSPRAAP